MTLDLDEGAALSVPPNPLDGHRSDFHAIEGPFRVTVLFLCFRHVGLSP
jgi:hypothetical protein